MADWPTRAADSISCNTDTPNFNPICVGDALRAVKFHQSWNTVMFEMEPTSETQKGWRCAIITNTTAQFNNMFLRGGVRERWSPLLPRVLLLRPVCSPWVLASTHCLKQGCPNFFQKGPDQPISKDPRANTTEIALTGNRVNLNEKR